MATTSSAAQKIDADQTPRTGGGPPVRPSGPAIASSKIAIIMLLAAETMFFTGLIGAYVVFKGTTTPWPPVGEPRLPIGVTWVNTFVLFLSAWTMWRAVSALHRHETGRLRWSMFYTALLGTTFLAVQGSEWTRLVFHGLTVSSSLYGATFYTLIGVHGLHVLGAVVWLLVYVFRFRGDRFSLKKAAGLDLCALYWYYVCALWAVLFPLVYLT